MRKFFVTGIDTGIGKTIVSSVLVEALKADYWKPVQSGYVDGTDLEEVHALVYNDVSVFHQESYNLRLPLSPNLAAEAENLSIELSRILVPDTSNDLIIEGVGGALVPLNNKETVIELIKHLDADVIVVVKSYLGSINHTCLTVNELRRNGIKICGLIFNGEENEKVENTILQMTGCDKIAHIPVIQPLNKDSIRQCASEIKLKGLIEYESAGS